MVPYGAIFFKMYKFVHLENVITFFSYSYLGSVHLSKMYNFVHLAEMAMVAKMYTVFVTYVLGMYYYLVHLPPPKISSGPIFSLSTHATHATTADVAEWLDRRLK